MLDGNFVLGCGPGTDYPYIHIFPYMLERTDAITNEVLEPITFVLAYPTVLQWSLKQKKIDRNVILKRISWKDDRRSHDTPLIT